MAYTPAWRNFRRMQNLTLTFAVLAFVADGLMAWPILPGTTRLKVLVIIVFPALYAAAVAAVGYWLPPARRRALRFVWITFKTGFGQSVVSVLLSVAILCTVAAYTDWVSLGAAKGGQYPAGAFSGFGAGIGILLVQVLMTRRLQADPMVRAEIEQQD